MQIAKNTVVLLHYELFGLDGVLIEKTEEPIEYLHGGYDGIFLQVEKSLTGKDVGDTCDVQLQPAEAFGEYDAELVQVEPRDRFPEKIEIGMRFQADSGKSGESLIYTVTDVAEEKVVVDGNHPLAGKALRFHCVVKAVRKATAEELAHGHVHGAHGHHH